jgi:hypothetical protein
MNTDYYFNKILKISYLLKYSINTFKTTARSFSDILEPEGRQSLLSRYSPEIPFR